MRSSESIQDSTGFTKAPLSLLTLNRKPSVISQIYRRCLGSYDGLVNFIFRYTLRTILNEKLYSYTRMSQRTEVIEKFLDKTIQILKNDTIKKKIELLIIQPFLQYSLDLIFPYVIILCVVFGILIISMISILCLLVFRFATPSAASLEASVVNSI